MTADDIPPDVRRLLDALPSPSLPPVDVAAILGKEVERQKDAARLWKWVAGVSVGLAAGVLLAVGLGGTRSEPAADVDQLRARLAKLEAAPVPQPPDTAKLDAKLADINDLLLTVAADVSERDEKQRLALRTLARQVGELRSLSDSRWTEAKTTTDALYILHQSSRKETNR